MLATGRKTPIIQTMSMLFPHKHKNRYIFEENIFFSREQICKTFHISQSCLTKQLKHILAIPGCTQEIFRPTPRPKRYKKYQRFKLTHFNLNTVVALAYRINNNECKKFLDSYHRVIYSMHLRLTGTNYFIPSTMTMDEFHYYAQHFCTTYDLDHEDG